MQTHFQVLGLIPPALYGFSSGMYSTNDFVLFEQNKAAAEQEMEAILCSLVT